jgi:nucleoside-diphosphate-sugar epimerase
MIYGAPGDRNLSRLLAVLARVPVLPVPGGGRHLQQPVHVADVADAVLSAAERPASAGITYDIAGPEPLSLAELLRVAAQAVGSRTRFVRVPLSPLVAAARGYALLTARPRIRAEQLQRLTEDKAFSIDDATRDLGYAPRPFAEGILGEARALGLSQEFST